MFCADTRLYGYLLQYVMFYLAISAGFLIPMSVMYVMGSRECPTLVRKFASLIFSCPRHLTRPHTLSVVSIVSYMGYCCMLCYFHDV